MAFGRSEFMLRAAIVLSLIAVTLTECAHAQRRSRQREPSVDLKDGKTIGLAGVPQWLESHDFKEDKSTFVRIRYSGKGGRSSWATDFPDADLNLAAQLGSMTKLDVTEPVGVHRVTDPALKRYPFAYLSEAGTLHLDDSEVRALREYLVGGGFLMVDDFWGDDQWNHFRGVMKRVLPNREPQELPSIHPLFHCVFDLKDKPQVTSINVFRSGFEIERADLQEAHYRAFVDDDDRIMVLICHNTDLADGWEWIGKDDRYTLDVSKKKALPMGINILFYALSNSGRD
jgi:hypothetical protein